MSPRSRYHRNIALMAEKYVVPEPVATNKKAPGWKSKSGQYAPAEFGRCLACGADKTALAARRFQEWDGRCEHCWTIRVAYLDWRERFAKQRPGMFDNRRWHDADRPRNYRA